MNKKVFILTFIFLFIDLISKYLIDIFFELDKSLIIIKNFFNITKVYNYGAAWSILSGKQFVLIIITFIILFLLIINQKKFKNCLRKDITFSLLYAGILGNLINRIFYGYVIDFFDFRFFSYNYPIFNIADIFIVIGSILLGYAILKKEDEYENRSR